MWKHKFSGGDEGDVDVEQFDEDDDDNASDDVDANDKLSCSFELLIEIGDEDDESVTDPNEQQLWPSDGR